MNTTRRRLSARLVGAAALLVTIVALYCRVSGFDFINLDDDLLLYRNSHVNTGLSLDNLRWAFTATDRYQWAPITWITHMLDFQVFGRDPSGHHVISALFHLFNVFALLAFLYKTTNDYWKSVFVAALFALHPLHVEPVAWLSARKDMVSTAFLLVALLSYVSYVRRPNIRRYLLTIAAYVLSLMAKPMYVTAPLLLLLLDYWPLHRIGTDEATAPGSGGWRGAARLVREKIPFFVAAAVFSGVAFLAQSRSGAVLSSETDSLASRASSVIVALARYVWKTGWPEKLAVVYPRPAAISPAEVIASAVLLVAISVGVARGASARRYLAVGWLWFLISMLPVIGIVPIGSGWMADKFTYIPIVGLFVIVAWGAPELLRGWTSASLRRSILAGAAVLVVALCAARSWRYLESWRNSVTLYTKALEVTENNFLVMGNLGAAYQAQGRYEDAMRCYHDAIRAEPRFDIGYANLGYLYVVAANDCERATPYLVTALRLNPGYRKAQTALAYCRARSTGR